VRDHVAPSLAGSSVHTGHRVYPGIGTHSAAGSGSGSRAGSAVPSPYPAGVAFIPEALPPSQVHAYTHASRSGTGSGSGGSSAAGHSRGSSSGGGSGGSHVSLQRVEEQSRVSPPLAHHRQDPQRRDYGRAPPPPQQQARAPYPSRAPPQLPPMPPPPPTAPSQPGEYDDEEDDYGPYRREHEREHAHERERWSGRDSRSEPAHSAFDGPPPPDARFEHYDERRQLSPPRGSFGGPDPRDAAPGAPASAYRDDDSMYLGPPPPMTMHLQAQGARSAHGSVLSGGSGAGRRGPPPPMHRPRKLVMPGLLHGPGGYSGAGSAVSGYAGGGGGYGGGGYRDRSRGRSPEAMPVPPPIAHAYSPPRAGAIPVHHGRGGRLLRQR
jgi:hypothetical protein